MTRARSVLAALLAAGLAGPAVGDDSKLKVKVGDPFPDVALPATQIDKVKKDAKEVSVSDLKGKTVVVFFYPKANTRGWTIESCGFRDVIADFPADTVVIGASADKMADQESFTKKNDLPYPLLSDADLKLIKALGVQIPGRDMAQRVTFVVDKEGKIAKIYDKGVAPDKHPKEVVAFVKGLSQKK